MAMLTSVQFLPMTIFMSVLDEFKPGQQIGSSPTDDVGSGP